MVTVMLTVKNLQLTVELTYDLSLVCTLQQKDAKEEITGGNYNNRHITMNNTL